MEVATRRALDPFWLSDGRSQKGMRRILIDGNSTIEKASQSDDSRLFAPNLRSCRSRVTYRLFLVTVTPGRISNDS